SLTADSFGPAAASHVETMNCPACRQSSLRQTPRIPGIARAFKAMHENQLCCLDIRRPLRMHEDLNAWFRFVEFLLDWKAAQVQLTMPEVAGDRGQMGVPEERDEWLQPIILIELQGWVRFCKAKGKSWILIELI